MSEVNDITTLVKGAAMVPSIVKDGRGVEHAFLPDVQGKFTRHELTPKSEIKPKPAFIDQIVNIDQAASLVDYVNRFKTASTVLFADVEERSVRAVIDYHESGSANPGLVEHSAILQLAHSHEWDTWAAISGRMYAQQAFAKMLDVNSDDIAVPSGAELLEKVMDLEMSTSITVQRKLVQTGSSRGEGGTQRKTDGTALPAFFTLRIPVFTGEPAVEVRAQTLDNIDGNTGKISLGLELVRTRIIVEQEMARITREIASKTTVPMIMGSLDQ